MNFLFILRLQRFRVKNREVVAVGMCRVIRDTPRFTPPVSCWLHAPAVRCEVPVWSRGSSVCRAWCMPWWLLSPGVSASAVSTDSSQTRAPRPVWARAHRELGRPHLSVRPSVQPALTQFTKGHTSTPRPQVCPHPRVLCSLRARGCSEEPCRPPCPIPGLPCTGARGCPQPAKRPSS